MILLKLLSGLFIFIIFFHSIFDFKVSETDTVSSLRNKLKQLRERRLNLTKELQSSTDIYLQQYFKFKILERENEIILKMPLENKLALFLKSMNISDSIQNFAEKVTLTKNLDLNSLNMIESLRVFFEFQKDISITELIKKIKEKEKIVNEISDFISATKSQTIGQSFSAAQADLEVGIQEKLLIISNMISNFGQQIIFLESELGEAGNAILNFDSAKVVDFILNQQNLKYLREIVIKLTLDDICKTFNMAANNTSLEEDIIDSIWRTEINSAVQNKLIQKGNCQ